VVLPVLYDLVLQRHERKNGILGEGEAPEGQEQAA